MFFINGVVSEAVLKGRFEQCEPRGASSDIHFITDHVLDRVLLVQNFTSFYMVWNTPQLHAITGVTIENIVGKQVIFTYYAYNRKCSK